MVLSQRLIAVRCTVEETEPAPKAAVAKPQLEELELVEA